tara:strand:+ start:207 stop:488 length:282 start_codon:yes stop_codon:yes gene_type:complete
MRAFFNHFSQSLCNIYKNNYFNYYHQQQIKLKNINFKKNHDQLNIYSQTNKYDPNHYHHKSRHTPEVPGIKLFSNFEAPNQICKVDKHPVSGL